MEVHVDGPGRSGHQGPPAPELQAGWKRLHQDGWQRRVGVEEEQAALWIETAGARLGFRPPD
eukprot:10812900-Lingulodinium_polyedra.AAC.1